MADHFASNVFTTNQGSFDRLQFSTHTITNSSDKITGGVDGLWIIEGSKVSFTITVENWDEGMYSQWPKGNKPYIFIRCDVDARFGGGIPIVDEDGTVLYTFVANHAADPRYIVLTLDTAAAGYHTWKLA